ncbi:MAG: nitroreductase family protein [Pelotomaculum sp.]|jgi:nitroreductase
MYELLKARRSIRQFQARPVEEDKLDNILKCALLAPSSRRRKPWEFVVVTERVLLQQLAACKAHGAEFLAGAPAAVVVLADPGLCDVWIEDASIAAILLQLAAQSQGLGSCWAQIRERFTVAGSPAEDYVRELLHIPGEFKVLCIIGMGYPAEDKPPYTEAGLLLNKLHYNRF